MKRLLLFVVLLSALAAIGCRPGRPVATYSYDAPSAGAQTALSEKQMSNAIVRACADRGWRYSMPAPGNIEASITVRNKHTVVVDIPYTATHYSINYKTSSNMEYKVKSDGVALIHPSYNKWVDLLDQRIRSNLAAY